LEKEGIMPLVDALLPEFDREIGVTRRMLAVVPIANGDWTPHAKSRTLRQLASHLANIPLMGFNILTLPMLDIGASYARQSDCNTTEELLARLDDNAAKTRGALVGRLDAELVAPWTMKKDGREMFALPKSAAWRNLMVSHLIHHRGQLTVYLRLNNVPVPPAYGPTADEMI
jgi:uncharacterized damage-inducible protein DinB